MKFEVVDFLNCNYELLALTAVNSDECLMTRMQEMSLNYHFIVEQEVGSCTYSFFGFNGRISWKKFLGTS